MFRDGQGEGGRVDLDGEPVGRIDRVAVELHRLGAIADPGRSALGNQTEHAALSTIEQVHRLIAR